MILVTGATGNVGSEAVRLLAERGLPVRALVRDGRQAKVTALAEAGAEIAVGDMEVPASVDAALADVTTVVLVSPGMPAQELNVIKSAARTEVGHVVKASSNASADSPIARRRWAAEIEAGLAASGLPHTLLRSNGYMQNTLALAPAIAKTSSFGSAAGAGKMGMVDARDVAAMAAEVAVSTSGGAGKAGHAGKTYWLTGPELITYFDVAAVLSKLLGRAVTYRELSFEENKKAMVEAGVPEPVAQMNAQAFSMIADGDGAWLSDDIPAVLGRPARSYEQFAEDYKAVFS
ncbi:MAG: NmrA family NAD(P)-binding protein [Streptosporangiaceae bacterium]